ncbi:hypothetical protein AAG906_013082 [Vitis piasezkii]
MGSYASNYLRLLSYTKLLASHVNQGRHHDALSLFHHMHASSAAALDAFVFLSPSILLVSNPFVACALVDMYGKCVSVSSARHLFDEIPHRNIVVWNAMISIYTHSGRVADALGLFEVMDVEPNASTFNAIISGLSGLEDGSFKALSFYRRMGEVGLKQNLITLLALLPACVDLAALTLIKEIHGYAIRMAYGRCGCIVNSQCVFQSISMSERDVVAWSSLISAYALHGDARTALETFEQMEMAKVQPDGITFLGATAKTWGALLGACRTYGEVELAEIAGRALFELEPDNAANYVLLARIYASVGRHEEAQRMRREMNEMGVKAAPGSSWVMTNAMAKKGVYHLHHQCPIRVIHNWHAMTANCAKKARFYLIGSDCNERFFQVLKIDHPEPYDLNISENFVIFPTGNQEIASADCRRKLCHHRPNLCH